MCKNGTAQLKNVCHDQFIIVYMMHELSTLHYVMTPEKDQFGKRYQWIEVQLSLIACVPDLASRPSPKCRY